MNLSNEQCLEQTGLIVKATGGFYYVAAGDTLWECRARGLFRKDGIKPLVGDWCRIEPTGPETGYLVALLPRKNRLIRPAVANLDRLVVVASVQDPAPNLLVIDKMMAVACHQKIQPALVITKSDLGEATQLEEIYRQVGIEVHTVSDKSAEGLEAVREMLRHGISAFSGNTGVGKSSLLNRIDSRLALQTGETSRKLGRGRHTTRHVELFRMGEDGYIADTPGFSAVDLERYEYIRKEELAECFPEFLPVLGSCQFTGCSHTVEKGCAVLKAVADGRIPASRHASYLVMYEDAKKVKEWEMER